MINNNQNNWQGMDILIDYQLNISKSLKVLKMDYLSDQKRRLQTQIADIYLNNQLLREINLNLYEGKSVDNQKLIKRNGQLQNLVQKLYKQIAQQRTHIFVTAQVKLEDQKEQKQINTNYQSKILQLRKLIQLKQGSIQLLQQAVNKDIAWTETTSIKVQLFQQIQQLKRNLQQYLTKCNNLLTLNKNLTLQINILKQKLQKVQQLTLSKCSYIQYKTLMNQKNAKSAPKLKTKLKKQDKFNKNLQYQQTHYTNRQSTLLLGNYQRDGSINTFAVLYKIIQQKNQQIKILTDIIGNLKVKISKFEEEKKSLLHSNAIYQRSRRTITTKSNMYESICRILYNYISQRKLLDCQLKRNSIDEDILRIPNKLKNDLKKVKQQTKVNCFTKEDWLNMQFQLQNKKIVTSGLSNIRQNKKRSLSCILDYMVINNTQVQASEKMKPQDLNDFSIQLDYKPLKKQNNPIIFSSNILEYDIGRKKKKNLIKSENIFLGAFDD